MTSAEGKPDLLLNSESDGTRTKQAFKQEVGDSERYYGYHKKWYCDTLNPGNA